MWTAHARAAIEDVAPLPKPAAEGRAAADERLQRRALTALLGSSLTGEGQQLAAYAPLLVVFGVPRVAERILQRWLGFVCSSSRSKSRGGGRSAARSSTTSSPRRRRTRRSGRSRLRALCSARCRRPCASTTAWPQRGDKGSRRRRARGTADGLTPA